jgi:hypothetical protein
VRSHRPRSATAQPELGGAASTSAGAALSAGTSERCVQSRTRPVSVPMAAPKPRDASFAVARPREHARAQRWPARMTRPATTIIAAFSTTVILRRASSAHDLRAQFAPAVGPEKLDATSCAPAIIGTIQSASAARRSAARAPRDDPRPRVEVRLSPARSCRRCSATVGTERQDLPVVVPRGPSRSRARCHPRARAGRLSVASARTYDERVGARGPENVAALPLRTCRASG